MATSIEERGYRDTTVADVVRIARTSRRTFYEHFEDREACFLALFDAVNDATMDRIAAAVTPEEPMDEQVDHALEAYIDSVTSHPALYQSFVRELPGSRAGGLRPRPRRRRAVRPVADRARRVRSRRAAGARGPAAVDGCRRDDRRWPARARGDLTPAGPRSPRDTSERGCHGEGDPLWRVAVTAHRQSGSR